MNHNNGMMGNMGMPMDMNNNPNMGNMPMNPNMMVLNQMNLQNQGFMMPQQPNDFNFQMYGGDQYLNNGIFMGNQNPNNGFGNLNYYGNPHLN